MSAFCTVTSVGGWRIFPVRASAPTTRCMGTKYHQLVMSASSSKKSSPAELFLTLPIVTCCCSERLTPLPMYAPYECCSFFCAWLILKRDCSCRQEIGHAGVDQRPVRAPQRQPRVRHQGGVQPQGGDDAARCTGGNFPRSLALFMMRADVTIGTYAAAVVLLFRRRAELVCASSIRLVLVPLVFGQGIRSANLAVRPAVRHG